MFNLNVLAFDITEFPQPLSKRTRQRVRVSKARLNSPLKEPDDGDVVPLVRLSY
jgi:hypothetical protein